MTPLRKCMIEDMRTRNFSENTQRRYIHRVAGYALHRNASPDQIRNRQARLADQRQLSGSTAVCIR